MDERARPHLMTPAEAAQVKSMDAKLSQVMESITALEKAGVDVTDLRSRYDEAAKLRAGMLQHLSPPAIRNRR